MLKQLALYKNLILVIVFAVLAITCVWLYHGKDVAETENTNLTVRVETIEKQFGQYHFDLEKAKADLATLRNDLDGINTQTEQLQSKLGLIPKPTTNGGNAKDIQTKANEVSKDAFGRAK